ncbi:MAG: lytic murein transglycosylase B [gamma proteobacterium symbiont of Bathyaustriella thionipta]|nr:lytic murein transglycosylase B [gamma proteobacterium symbiont of Bathyaustriella thionipta]MCU7948608.1 lytic murein transglycosylase B [gamma proteobacterium symbiont of Bathyaustriella thionipta]MCU7952887.1 lytic murein transglycosylase B [gamma proteobacterium symbiont of Bathyaustriella thionipta]MCU7955141.1 lytic murein transglycosylase B [gamma proteobacterium symbiont of Bathyaustriella thionipta]MCU7965613.1 lytic murein transglycosylase B [gamma proteobacterium symbiont of Bathy
MSTGKTLRYTMLSTLILCVIMTNISYAANLAKESDVQQFIAEMVKEHGFKKADLNALFAQVKVKQKILDAISRPAEKSKAWHEYRKIFLTEKRIKNGVKFWQENSDIISYAEEVYGVAPEIMVAIIGVETYYGSRQGSYRVMDALSTLAFKYPRRSKFFRSELKHFLIMSQEQQFDPLTKKGSYAGAMGMGQFIPSSFQSYAIDFDGDGEKNIWTNHSDAIGSVANYFKRHGWKTGQPVTDQLKLNKENTIQMDDRCKRSCKPKLTVADFKQKGLQGSTSVNDKSAAILLILKQKGSKEYWLGYNNFYVISRYNHSTLYSMAVYQLSQEIKQAYQASK